MSHSAGRQRQRRGCRGEEDKDRAVTSWRVLRAGRGGIGGWHRRVSFREVGKAISGRRHAARLPERLGAEGDDYLLRGAGGEREPECASGVGEGNVVADQPGETLLVLRDLQGDLEDLGGVALGRDDGHLAAQQRAQVDGLGFFVHRDGDQPGAPLGRPQRGVDDDGGAAASM